MPGRLPDPVVGRMREQPEETSSRSDADMQTRRLGALDVSELGAGCMSITANYGPPAPGRDPMRHFAARETIPTHDDIGRSIAVCVLQAQCGQRDPDLMDSATKRIRCSGQPTLHRRDDARAQFSRRNDRMHRANLAGPLHVVHGFKLRCHFAELVRTYRRPGGTELHP